MNRERLRVLVLTAVLGLMSACVSSRPTNPFVDLADDTAQADLYRQLIASDDSTPETIEEAQLRLGALYADTTSTLYDADEARRLLVEIAVEASDSSRRRDASLLIKGLDLAAEIARRDRRILALRAQLGILVDAQHKLLAEIKDKDEHASELAESVRRLTIHAQNLAGEISDLEDNLEQIKAIDLGEARDLLPDEEAVTDDGPAETDDSGSSSDG